MADGQKRGLYPTIVALLDHFGLVDARARETLAPWARRAVRNYRGLVTGEVRPALAPTDLGPQRASLSSGRPG
jgi:L-asparaginase II